MPSTASLVKRLTNDFPDFRFVSGDDFRWSAEEVTVYYDRTSDDSASLLHEVAHGILGHTDYSRDIELLQMERDAWGYASTILGPTYSLVIEDGTVQDSLDSYRNWLHARSTCPHCKATGLQTKKEFYACPACHRTWHVNEARNCGLRRTLANT